MVDKKIKFRRDVVHNLSGFGMVRIKGGTSSMEPDGCETRIYLCIGGYNSQGNYFTCDGDETCKPSTYPWCSGPNPTIEFC